MRRGVFGGSFDPIHLGHLLLAETAWEELNLDKLVFMPAQRSPWKPGTGAAPEQRWEMVSLAVAGRDGFEVSRLELERSAPSYTFDTLSALKKEFPQDELWLIIGADGIKDLPSWRNCEEIFKLARIAVGQRPGNRTVLPPGLMEKKDRIRILNGPCCALSSSEIRARIREGRSVRYRVPLSVEQYIAENGLYR